MRKIAGKEPLTRVKARVWREFAKFNEKSALEWLDNEDGLVDLAGCIGQVYGLTAEEVLDDLAVDEIMPVYGDCWTYLLDMITGRLPKNATGDSLE